MRVVRAVAVALGALLLLASCGGDDEPPLERALELVEDDGGFGTALESGDTFAHVAELLIEGGEACSSPCPAVMQAAAYVQVVAAQVLECSLPEIHDARRLVRDHVAEVTSSPSTSEAELPPLPSC